jgi:hypothetical protein
MTGTQHVGTLKHKFLEYITIINVLVLFHYQNNFETNSSSAIWWRHLPVACNNFFEAGVSGNTCDARVRNIVTFSSFHFRDTTRSPRWPCRLTWVIHSRLCMDELTPAEESKHVARKENNIGSD